MRLERMSVVLRPRTPWEAMDLGMALARRHAGAVWRPWLALSLPILVVVNAFAFWIDRLWLAPLLMWWLKPVFERASLYVLSRAVFGEAPPWRQAATAPEVWRAGSLLGWLSWRRLHPARPLLMPVDLLENLAGERRRRRVAVLQAAVGGQALGLLLAGLAFEAVLVMSGWALLFLFVPLPLMDGQAQLFFRLFVQSPPVWAQLLGNAATWAASTAIGPLVTAAGFGLYLNRRTQLEAWDLELVFRRLGARVRDAGWAPVLLACAWLGALLGATPALAQAEVAAAPATSDVAPAPKGSTDKGGETKPASAQPLDARRFVGELAWRAPEPGFRRAIARAYLDPTLLPTRQESRWRAKYKFNPDEPAPRKVPGWVKVLTLVTAVIAEYGLWILACLLLAFLLWKLPRWMPWVRERLPERAAPAPIVERPSAPEAPLPLDVPAHAEALWQSGQHREALALLYRGSVEAIATRLGAPFPPGATEAECLRRARRLPDAEATGEFARIVRAWQAAAYAWRFPDAQGFADLLAGWRRQFGAGA